MNKNLVYLITALLTLSIFDAHACSCTAVPEQQKYLSASDVFLGTVVETKLVTKIEKFDEQEISTEHVGAKIRITKPIKGKSTQSIDLLDAVTDGANCAVGLFTGREYLFYLSGSNLLSLCDGTRLYNELTDQDLVEKMLAY